jgi:eukaryotic-like serine/threonine-protein kinase
MRRHDGGNSPADTDPAYELTARGKTLLQERLTTVGLVATLVAVGYFPGFYFTWRTHPGIAKEAITDHVLAPWPFLLVSVHGALWLIGRGRPLPPSWLRVLDVAHCVAVGALFGRVLSTHPSPALAPLEGIPAVASVLGIRALVVPSTGKRTVLAGTLLALGPLLTVLSNAEHFSASFLGVQTSGPLFLIWALVAIVLTSVASEVLYGLRRDVRDARRLGQYTLVERLGEGGMGVVYRAEHALLRRPTAVKLLPATKRLDSIARFEREVQLMAELTHPNTVAIYDYGRTDAGVFYYAMEYLEGIDLEGLVEVGGPQPAGRVIHLLRQVCGSLDEAHERGLIHRDVKPANLFLCKKRGEPDTVKVLDFGLVKDVSADDPSLSTANSVLGTPLYMAPEAFTKPEAVDARSDLYSLGAVAYLLLVGAPVFSGSSSIEVLTKHLHLAPRKPSERLGQDIPAGLEAVVMSCLEKPPEKRPASARALRDALDGCASVPVWTAGEAEAWWREHAERVEARRRRVQVGTSKTVVVDLARPLAALADRSAS